MIRIKVALDRLLCSSGLSAAIWSGRIYSRCSCRALAIASTRRRVRSTIQAKWRQVIKSKKFFEITVDSQGDEPHYLCEINTWRGRRASTRPDRSGCHRFRM